MHYDKSELFPNGFDNRKLHIHGWKPDDALSDKGYFKFKELTGTDTGNANKIVNAPCHDVIANACALTENVLDPIREKFGVSVINSWYRCEELEKHITKSGFADWCVRHGKDRNDPAVWTEYFNRKQHPKGMAADVEALAVSNTELYNWIKANLQFDQLILENVKNPSDPRSGWVHVSFNPFGNNRNQAFEL